MKKYLLAIFAITAFYSNCAEQSLRKLVSTLSIASEDSLSDDPRNTIIQQLTTDYVNSNAFNLKDAVFIQQLIGAQVISSTAEIDRYLSRLSAQREFERLTTWPAEDLVDALNESVGHESDYSDRTRETLHDFRRRFPDVDVLSLPYKEFPTLRHYLISLEDTNWDSPNKYIERFNELYR